MEQEKIFNQLVKIGFSKKRVGTLYMTEAIMFLYENRNCMNLEAGVYKYLADKHNKKLYTIKSNLLMTCRYASKKAQKKLTPKFVMIHILKYNLSKKR